MKLCSLLVQLCITSFYQNFIICKVGNIRALHMQLPFLFILLMCRHSLSQPTNKNRDAFSLTFIAFELEAKKIRKVY